MNKLILASIFFLTVFNASHLNAQSNPPSLHWEKNINGVVAGQNQHVKSVKDAAGNIYALSHSDSDFKVVKFNSTGGIIKVYTYNNPYNQFDMPYDIAVDAAENVFVCGMSFIDYKYHNTIVKFNESGSIAWSNNVLTGGTWVYPTDVSARALVLDNAGNVLYTGNMNDSLTIGKISPSGTVLFSKTIFIDGIGIGTGLDIVTDASGSFFVAGYVKNAAGNKDAVIFKADAAGNFVWRKIYAGTALSDDQANLLGIDNSSNLYVAGNVADVSSTNTTASIVKLNASGAQQWIKNLFITGQISGTSTALIVDGIGNSYLATNIKTSASASSSKIYKHNTSGVQDYLITVDDATLNENITTSMDLDLSNNLFIAGNDSYFSGKAYYAKYNNSGLLFYYNVYTTSLYSGYVASIFVDNSSSPNLITTMGSQIHNVRYDASGVYQYVNVYSGSGNQFDKCVKVLTQGNQSIYALGSISNEATYEDIVLGKYNAQGDILWQNIIDYAGSGNNAFDFGNDATYNIYMAGSSPGTTYLSKYDSIGSPLWVNTYPGTFNKIYVDNAGNTYMAGENSSGSKYSVKKIGPTGTSIYSNIPSTINDSMFYVKSVDIDATNRFYVAGTMIESEYTAAHNIHCVVQKFSSTGNLLWSHQVHHLDSVSSSSNSYTTVKRVLVDASNDVYIYGQSSGANTTPTHMDFTFIIKLDNSGNQIWRKEFNNGETWHEYAGDMKFSSGGTILMYAVGGGNQVIRRIDKTDGSTVDEGFYNDNILDAVAIDEDLLGNVIVAGNTFQIATLRDYAVAKFDSNLDYLWTQHYGGAYVGSDEVTSMKVTSNNRIYVTGMAFSTPGLSPDFNLIKLCDIAPPDITSSGSYATLCPGNTVMLSSSGTNYLWNTGETTASIVVNSAGDYFCTVSKSDGCAKGTDTLSVTIKAAPIAPEICLVTVDDSSTHNIIYWDKTGFTDVDHFIVYREDFTSSYTPIGTVPFDSLSEYHDYAINPNVTTKRYKLSAVDTCGTESALSQYHNTLYCTDLGSGQFFWNLYEIESSANPVVNYVIMRQDSIGTAWHELDTTAGTQQTLNDPTFASFPYASWRVKTVWGITCSPTRAGISTSRSNIRNKNALITNVSNVNAAGNAVTVYPNPSSNNITVSYQDLTSTILAVSLKDASGRLIEQKSPTATSINFSLTQLERGFYFVEVLTDMGKIVKQVIKN